jgi:hypothetical protein
MYLRFFDLKEQKNLAITVSTKTVEGFHQSIAGQSCIKLSFLLCLTRLQGIIFQGSKSLLNRILTGNREHQLNDFRKNTLLTQMKQIVSIFLVALILAGCGKTTETPETKEAMVARLLTGNGNRYWRLSKVYVNDAPVVLTDAQMKFTKTYTLNAGLLDPSSLDINGTFVNSDGYKGTWAITNSSKLYEKITNNPAGPVASEYKINAISDNSLDIEATANLKTVREVYYAY